MDRQRKSYSLFHPLRSLMSIYHNWSEEQKVPRYGRNEVQEDGNQLSCYPLDMSPSLALPRGTLDDTGVPYNAPTKEYPAAYHPTTIAEYALAHWNSYLATGHEKHKRAFMTQAYWLVEHELCFEDGRGGWLIPFSVPEYFVSEPWLSAMTQGECISVLVRAYQLSGEKAFLRSTQRAIRTFELDIRDGGVCTYIENKGIFFEEVAAYPAAHILNGYFFALFGLYDYVTLTNDPGIVELIKSSLITLYKLINEYDTGYWSLYGLLHRNMATQFYHSLHVSQLEVLAHLSSCEHFAIIATRWTRYQQSGICQLRYFIASRFSRINRTSLIPRWIAYYHEYCSHIFLSSQNRGK